MTENVGTLDRTVRIAIGILLLLAAALVKDQLGWLGMTGFVPLLTGIFGNCPLYTLLHIDTRRGAHGITVARERGERQ